MSRTIPVSDIERARKKSAAKARAAIDEKIIARASHLLGPCPNLANHTPHPAGYIEHHAWMNETAKTHRQTQCPSCGLWAIWIKKETPNV